MLAYVFWHRPREDADADAYERSELDFHRALAEHGPAGFVRSSSARVSELPWLDGRGYEDWYLVEDYAALGRLGPAATDEARGPAHDRAAAMLADGTAGLYKLVDGSPEAIAADRALWLSRPLGSPYPTLAQLLSGRAATGAGLWRRELVLGPAPEICVLHQRGAAPRPPQQWPTLAVEREVL